jgi:hypothetical protein
MKFSIIGGGSWATALAKLLTDNGQHIGWWVRNEAIIDQFKKRRHNPHYLSSVFFNLAQLSMSTSVEEVVADADVVLFLHDLTRLQDPDYQREDARIRSQLSAHDGDLERHLLHAYNKADAATPPEGALAFSAQTGAGLDALVAWLQQRCRPAGHGHQLHDHHH